MPGAVRLHGGWLVTHSGVVHKDVRHLSLSDVVEIRQVGPTVPYSRPRTAKRWPRDFARQGSPLPPSPWLSRSTVSFEHRKRWTYAGGISRSLTTFGYEARNNRTRWAGWHCSPRKRAGTSSWRWQTNSSFGACDDAPARDREVRRYSA